MIQYLQLSKFLDVSPGTFGDLSTLSGHEVSQCNNKIGIKKRDGFICFCAARDTHFSAFVKHSSC